MDLDTVKSRIRKLMNYASDPAAHPGEVENALRHAMRLVDEHHLSLHDVTRTDAPPSLTFSMHAAFTNTRVLTPWERTLGHAVRNLYGTLRGFIDPLPTPLKHQGVVQVDDQGNPILVATYSFVGPTDDATEAAELFTEWTLSIATLAAMKFGDPYRKAGQTYCEGFAFTLLEMTSSIDASRASIPLHSTTGAITLHQHHQHIQKQAYEWLLETHPNVGNYRGPSLHAPSRPSNAWGAGRADGSASGFGRPSTTPKRKLLG